MSEVWRYDEEAEVKTLGSILGDGEFYELFAGDLTKKSFLIERHQWVWESFGELRQRGIAITVKSVAAQLDSKGLLGEVGSVTDGDGKRFLEGIERIILSVEVPFLIDRLRNSSINRALETTANKVGKLMIDTKKDGFEKIATIQSMIDKLSKRSAKLQPVELMSADEILNTDWPEPNWAVPGILPAGLGIMAGKAKLGKSWLMLQICQAVASGGQVFGIQVEQRPVLYLALEDPPRRLKSRMKLQGWQTGTSCDMLTMRAFQSQIGDLRDGGGQRIANMIDEKGYGLVGIDTFSKSIHGDQKDIVAMTMALSPIHLMAAEKNSAVMLVDHHRKLTGANPDAIQDIIQSTAKGAVVDTAWGLYRERGKMGAKLQITGRDVFEKTLALNWLPAMGFWDYEGDADQIAITERRSEILELLKETGSTSLTDIASALGQDRSNTSKRLVTLCTEGFLERDWIKNKFFYYVKEKQDEAGLPDYLIDG